jgi:hypothetical protein
MSTQTAVKARSDHLPDILVLAGHPFVMDASPLLSALKSATGEDFGANVGAAVHWAQQTYDIRPDRLRPPPLESWPLFTGSRRDINLNTAEAAAGRIGDLGAIALGVTRPVREEGDLEHQPLRPDAAGEWPRASAQARRRLGGTSEPLLLVLEGRSSALRPKGAARPPRDDCRGWPEVCLFCQFLLTATFGPG